MTEPESVIDLAPDDNMALNHVDKEWIALTVRESIHDHYRSKMARFRDWSPVGAITAVALFALLQWNGYTVFRTHTEDRLDTIEAELRRSAATLAPAKVLNEIKSLDQKTFAKNLPALRQVIDQPVSEVAPPPATLQAVAGKLRLVNERTEDYWPTALRFIEFATSGLSPDVPPPGPPNLILSDVMMDPRNPNVFTQRRVLLDQGSFRGLRFENCRIIFSMNAVHLQNVLFVNCVFEFPKVETLNAYLMQAGRELLKQNQDLNSTVS